ncbi:atherin-like isoform X2 [Pan troglodytes]|uniref:atherin-like isoform X2 n=1 Tax=Pan troglodytes TaxID=9598 RepID=UPI0023F1807A|nr:atherin-like isoform X1 [Pan troglodytes]
MNLHHRYRSKNDPRRLPGTKQFGLRSAKGRCARPLAARPRASQTSRHRPRGPAAGTPACAAPSRPAPPPCPAPPSRSKPALAARQQPQRRAWAAALATQCPHRAPTQQHRAGRERCPGHHSEQHNSRGGFSKLCS